MDAKTILDNAWPIKRFLDVVLVRPSPPGVQLASIRAFDDSLASEHINNGDLIVFRMTREAMPGQLVVALTPNGVTIRRYTSDGNGSIWLTGAEESEWWDADQVTIQGVVIQSIREHF